MAYGCRVEYVSLSVEAVDTHRDKPSVPGTLDDKFIFDKDKIDAERERNACNGSVIPSINLNGETKSLNQGTIATDIVTKDFDALEISK